MSRLHPRPLPPPPRPKPRVTSANTAPKLTPEGTTASYALAHRRPRLPSRPISSTAS